MVLITLDGNIKELPLLKSVPHTHIEKLVDGPWKIWATVYLPGKEGMWYVIGKTDMHTLPQNNTASRLASRIVWGSILFVEKGVELP